ncbi:MAG: Holliday junction branch migration protein RuvA [Patescibacteria group bacterium]
MIYSLAGRLSLKRDKFVVVESGGVGLKVAVSSAALNSLPAVGSPVNFFCHLRVKEDALELYGFLSEEELDFFELLNGVSGVGPKSALAVLALDKVENLEAAIAEGKSELLTRVSGIGRKTAERIILDLKDKMTRGRSAELVGKMESDLDLEEALAGLGYRRFAVKEAIKKIPKEISGMESRLREALKILGNKK